MICEPAASRPNRIANGRLRAEVARFQDPILGKSLWQVANSFGGFFATCAAMYALLDVSYWITLALALLAAGFLVRIFIIQHDCGHFSFFRRQRANDLLGMVASVVTLAPYASWRRQHAGHHGVWNDLDRRQSGSDIYSSCLTVAEYRALPPLQRCLYRMSRQPIVANIVLPPLIFLVLYRFPFDMPRSWRKERRAVHLTSLVLAAVVTGLGLLVGFWEVLAVQMPVMIIASIIGVWLFSVQHRGPSTRWFRHREWDPVTASLQGTVYLRLPAVLQWFTGNIGFHHIHHLNPRVPNYRLQACHERAGVDQTVSTTSLKGGLKALSYVLWDENYARMARFGEATQR